MLRLLLKTLLAGALLLRLTSSQLEAKPIEVIVDPAALRTLIVQEIRANGLKAVILGVWVDREEKFLEAFGESMSGVPAAPNMHFRVGGVTLTSLCVVLLKLVEDGVVKLDDPIAKWRPDLPNADRVSLRMLADCTAGYPDYVPVESFQKAFDSDVFREWSDDELIAIAMQQPFPYHPGKGWNYSHTSFVILGGILERITGKPLTEIFEERIFTPLGLKESSYATTPAIAPPVLHAYDDGRGIFEESTFWNPSWTGASGRMVSTVADVGRIAMALAGPGILSEASRDELVAPRTVGLGKNTEELFYGMGIGVVGGWLVQNPNMNGFHTLMATLPKNRVTIVVTSTTDDGYKGGPAPSTALFHKIAARIVPGRPVPASFK